MEFRSSEEVIAKLGDILPKWNSPLYTGDEELRHMVDSVDLSMRVDNGLYANVTIEVENHSKIDVVIKSMALWSKDIRVCRPVFQPEGVVWRIPAERHIPIQFTAKENVALALANIYEEPPPEGNFPRTFRAELLAELRCEILGVERTFKEKSNVSVDVVNWQITGVR